jgi:hypothetical protein
VVGVHSSELGLDDSVEFLGERSDVETVVRALDVLVAPSWEEPFGRSIIEAMALETPVVATSIGGPAEFIEDGVDGVLLPPTAVADWANAIERLLDDQRGAAEMAHRASAKVRAAYDSRTYAERTASVYDEILRGGIGLAQNGPTPTTSVGRDRRFRILFVEHTGVIGGGQRSLLELVRCLRTSHDLTLACPEGELADAAQSWTMKATAVVSRTDAAGRILVLQEVAPRSARDRELAP